MNLFLVTASMWLHVDLFPSLCSFNLATVLCPLLKIFPVVLQTCEGANGKCKKSGDFEQHRYAILL